MNAEASINPGQLTGPSLETKDNPKIAAEGIETGQPSTESSEYHLPQVADSPEEDSNPTKPKKKTGAIIAGAAVAAAAVTTGAILGVQSWIGLNRNDGRPNEDPNNPRPTAGAPANPVPVQTETSLSTPTQEAEKRYPDIPKELMDETEAWTSLSEKDQARFMELLTEPEARDKLSQSERFALSMKIGEFIDAYAEKMLTQYNPEYRPPVAASIDNSPQQVLDQVGRRRAVAFLMLTEGNPDKYGAPNITDGNAWLNMAKVYIEGVNTADSPDIEAMKRYLETLPNLSTSNRTGYANDIVVANAKSIDTPSKDRDVIVGRTITYTEEGLKGQRINGQYALIKYAPFGSDSDKKTKTAWIAGNQFQGQD